MNVEDIAPGLQFDDAGYWVAPATLPVSYPEDGNEFCLSVEESSFWFAHRNRAIVAAIHRYPPADGPLLDVGAGNGFVSAGLIAAGFSVVAIEPNPSGARNASSRGLTPVICGMLPSPAFKTHSAAAIGLFDVLEHISDDREFLTSLRPYLKQNGRLYATVPAYPWLWSADDVAAGHRRRYTLRKLCDVLHTAGFEVEYATYMFSWLPIPILSLRSIPSRLRRHRVRAFAPSKSAHTAGGRWSRGLLLWSFAFEVGLISKGIRIPGGGSCLIVGRLR